MASAAFGLLAISPRKTTGALAELIRRPASRRDASAARPCSVKLLRPIGLHCASPVITSIGRLTNAEPGRADSAARKADASTSARADRESISAAYLVTGLHTLTESIVWCKDLRRFATETAPPSATRGSPSE